MALKKIKEKWSELDTLDKVDIIGLGIFTGCMGILTARGVIGMRRSNKAYQTYLEDLSKQNDKYHLEQLGVIRDTLNNK